MLKNYFKIAWRNLIRNKAYSAINILGLALGMAVALLIGLWISDELHVNKNFPHYDRLVRVMENSTHGSHTDTWSSMPIPLATEMRTKYASDFAAVALASWNGGHTLTFGDNKLSKPGMYAQPELANMLSLKMISGGAGALNEPSSIILDRSLAAALFGAGDPMNKIVKVDNGESLKVTGVYEDFPYNSEFSNTHYLIPWERFVADNSFVRYSQTQWDNNSFQIYAQLQDKANLDQVAARLRPRLNGHDRSDKPEVILQPMSKWHLYNEFKEGRNTGGTIQFVKMFGLVGLFVLLLACINFMNLSTARSERRAKEVGIRKAVGSLRRQLVIQFLGESLLITILALLLSVLLVRLSLSAFNQVADKKLSIPWGNPFFWMMTGAFVLFTGIVAGSYPAFYLSSFNSVKVLKGTFKAGRLASIPRKVLVVLQFTVSVSLIIGTIIVYMQLQYARNRPVGYNREGLITLYMNSPDLISHYSAVRRELLNGGGIADMALSGSPTTQLWNNQSGFDWPGKDPNFKPSFGVVPVTQDFGHTVKWEFTEGRDFSRDFASDSSGMVLNEEAVKYMGLKHPVGANVKYLFTSYHNNNFRVIGVIRNMVVESPFEPVRPMIFLMDSAATSISVMNIRLNPAVSTEKALALIAPVFKRYNPGSTFEYTFNDEEYSKKFVLERRISTLTTIFALFAIFISCLGLFGLASFMAEQRTKEIGLRKVLGASVFHLWALLSKEFLILVCLSFSLACPVSYYVMHNWLQQYNYHIGIPAWIFLFTMGIALLITMLTVSTQSIRASLANPVKSLRTE